MYFLLPKTFAKSFEIMHCLHPYALAPNLPLHCLCWHIATFLGTLLPPVDQWNNMKHLAYYQQPRTNIKHCSIALQVVKNSSEDL